VLQCVVLKLQRSSNVSPSAVG